MASKDLQIVRNSMWNRLIPEGIRRERSSNIIQDSFQTFSAKVTDLMVTYAATVLRPSFNFVFCLEVFGGLRGGLLLIVCQT